MTSPPSAGADGALAAALATGTRQAFTEMLTDDVHWGGEHGGDKCSTRAEAGDFYEGLLSAGVTLRITEVREEHDGADGPGSGVLLVRLEIRSQQPDDLPEELLVRLTLREGLIADICELDPPPTIELLYFEGCPNHHTFLPHLRALLAAHDVVTPITLVHVDSDDVDAMRFLGSPTLRVNGHDIDPSAAQRDDYGLQCRLYSTPHGTKGTPPDQWIIDALVESFTHVVAVSAVHTGDLPALRHLLDEHPELASARLPRHEGRTLLDIATDWPGHFPGVAATIGVLVAAGADPDAPGPGGHPETPLHCAASSGDLDAITALLDAGADINATGAVIAGGTAMADATAFGQWDAAHLLLDRGASTNLFEAASLGLLAHVEARLDEDHPSLEAVTSSFWGACHGGRLDTATVLLDHGAEINWVGYDDLTPLDAARRAAAPDVVDWLVRRGAVSAVQPG